MPYTYEDVGATRDGRCPPGFHPLHVRSRIGEGQEVFKSASQAVLTWDLHRAVGVKITTDAPQAAPGVDVTVGLGLLQAPCRIVWTVDEPRRAAGPTAPSPATPNPARKPSSSTARATARSG